MGCRAIYLCDYKQCKKLITVSIYTSTVCLKHLLYLTYFSYCTSVIIILSTA